MPIHSEHQQWITTEVTRRARLVTGAGVEKNLPGAIEMTLSTEADLLVRFSIPLSLGQALMWRITRATHPRPASWSLFALSEPVSSPTHADRMPLQVTSVVEIALDRPLLLIGMSLGEPGTTMSLGREWTAGIAMTAVVAFPPLLPTLTVMSPGSRKPLSHRSP